ncbi:MAG: M20 family metallopeptidase [Deltaproteobacteria bacterium]|nr:M20 family metallopeptidase [Candidatus Zymogenaceae bacterium]
MKDKTPKAGKGAAASGAGKFAIDPDTVIDFLRSILVINTENPPGNEEPVARVIAGRLMPLGFEVEFFEPEPKRTSLLAVLRGEGGGRSLLMNGHIDIGPIGEGWTKDPLAGEIEDGKIYGRGTGDMKSGVAAMVCAAEAVVASRLKRRGDLYLTFVADESSGGHKGSGYLIRRAKIDADMGVICEPSGGHIGIAHRGTVWVSVEVIGKSGQATKPNSGVNAISCAAGVIAALDRELPPILKEIRHPILPEPCFNFGTIAGGIKTNVIADRCSFTIDRRTIPGERTEEVIEQVRTIADRALLGTGAQVTVKAEMVVEASEVSPDLPIIDECKRAMAKVVDMEPLLGGGGGFTDAHWFTNDLGIPTVIFGPWYLHFGDGSISDIPDEYNYIEDIITGTTVYAHLIANIIG